MTVVRRRALDLVAVVVLLVAAPLLGAGASSAAPPRQAEPDTSEEAQGPDPFDRLAGCISTTGRLLVVLLVDESGSLNSTDPEARRVDAAQAAVASLDRLRSVEVAGRTPEVDIQVAVFSNEMTALGEWTPLDDGSLPSVQQSIDSLAERNDGRDTDFHNALDGARASLSERVVAAGGGTDAGVCKAILLFTDGDFAIGPRTTPEELETYGATKTYAPDIVLDSDEAVRDARQKGIDALCEDGGVADQVRSDQISLITVPLTNKLREGAQRLIEAITTGEAVDRTCGTPSAEVPGAYLPAADPEELLRVFDGVGARIAGGALAGPPVEVEPCAEEACPEGTVEVQIGPSLRRVRIFATVPGEDSTVVLTPPEGDALEVSSGEDVDEEVSGVPTTSEWFSVRSVALDLTVPADGTGAGTWKVAVVGPSGDRTATIQVITFSDVVADLVEGQDLRLGEEVELVTAITTRSGDGDVPTFEEATVTGTFTDPITGRSILTDEEGRPRDLLFAADEDGTTFRARLTVPREVTAASVRASFRLRATTEEGATVTSLSPDEDLAVRRPDGYPQVAPARLDLTSIERDDQAEGELVLVAGGDAVGCAWFEGFEVRSAPEAAGRFAVTASGIGRSAADCTDVDAPLTVPVTITPGAPASGTVRGHLRLHVAQADGVDPLITDVPVTFEMTEGVDEAKRLALAAALLLAGLLAPLLLLLLINLLTTRFQDLSRVRAAKVPVAVVGNGQIVRTDGGRRALRLLGSDFAELEGEGGHRSFTWGGLRFRARTSVNPFGEPHAVISPEGGTADVSREGRRTDLALGLTGSWLFLLDQDATAAATERIWARDGGGERPKQPPEIHGHIVAFVAEGPVPAQAARLVEEIDDRLPRTARDLARLAKL